MARLRDVCSIRSSNHAADKEKNWLLNLDVVEQQTGKVLEYNYVPENGLGGSIVSFDTDNVLYSKLRPNLNKVVIPEKEGYATSEMLPLYPDEKQITREYLACYLRSPSFVDWAVSKTAGAKMPRLGTKELLNKEISLPAVDLQKKITEALFLIDSLIFLRKKQLQKLDDLVKSRFVEMFGDLANSNCTWDSCKLVDTCAKSEDIKCGPFGTQLNKDEYQSDGVPVWEIPQINSSFAIKPEHFLTEHKAKQLQAYSLLPRDIVMSRKGNVGKCALFPDDKQKGILHSDVLRIRVSEQKANPCFMMFQLHYSRDVLRQIEQVSTGAIMAGVNVTKLKDISVKLPPMELQRAFESIVVNVNNSKLTVQQGLDKLELLKQSLMQKYFG